MSQLERFPDGLTMSELSRRLIVSNGAITGLVDKLAGAGLVDAPRGSQGPPQHDRAADPQGPR